MAQTLLSKLQILVSATLHSMLDRALESNSLAVFDDYIRQAETGMKTLTSAVADLNATVKTLRVKYDDAANEAAELDLQIDAALKANKTVLAKAAQAKLNSQLQIAQTYKEQFEKQSATTQLLVEVIQVLDAKVDILKGQRSQVATLLDLIKSKNLAARSIKDVQAIADNHAKDIVENVRKQLDTADAQLEVASSRLSTQIDNELSDVSLNAQLEERRQRLGLS